MNHGVPFTARRAPPAAWLRPVYYCSVARTKLVGSVHRFSLMPRHHCCRCNRSRIRVLSRCGGAWQFSLALCLVIASARSTSRLSVIWTSPSRGATDGTAMALGRADRQGDGIRCHCVTGMVCGASALSAIFVAARFGALVAETAFKKHWRESAQLAPSFWRWVRFADPYFMP